MSSSDRRALVVGVQAYLDAGLAPRPGTCAALRAIAEHLAGGGFEVALLVDDAAHDAERPLLANLLDRLGWLAAGDEAPLLVLSGHLEESAFLPRDARRSLLGRTALSLDELVELLPASAGVVVDAPAPAAPFAGLAWALGAGTAPPARFGTRGPTRFLRTVQRALGGEAAPGEPLTVGALFDFVTREAATASAPPPWHHGPPDHLLLDQDTRPARPCPACGAEVKDGAATFCPSCGAPQRAEELLDDGRYRLMKTLGEGGMGQVFLAEDTRLKVRRAIKLLSLPPGLPVEEQRSLQQRMLQEARAAQKLSDYSHHIVRVFDVGHARERDEPFLVMEVLEGETLSQRMARGKLPLTAALSLGRTIAETLAIAHTHAVVHRDLKPDNVMLIQRGDDDAFVKLLDFGLVKMEQAEVKTQSGRMMGTLQYMPPEQLRGMQVDARADVFSLGAVLYEMLSGQRANPGRTQQEIFGVLLDRGVKPLAELCPHLPPRLTALVDQCLRLIREQRPPHAGAVAEALASIRPSELAYEPTLVPSDAPPAPSPTPSVGSGSLAHGEVSSVPTLPPSPARRLLLPAAALAIGGLIWGLWPAPPPPAAPDAAVAVARPAVPDAAVAQRAPDVGAQDAAAPAPFVRPDGALPAQLTARAALEDDRLVYRGADAAARFAALVADLTLAEAAPPAADDAARAAWAEAPEALRRWLAEGVPLGNLVTQGDALLMPRAAALALHGHRPKRQSLGALGEIWTHGARPPALAAARCGDAAEGDRLVTARWSTRGYGSGRCEGNDCAGRLVRALQHARSVGESMRVTLTLAREADEAHAEVRTVAAQCRVRP